MSKPSGKDAGKSTLPAKLAKVAKNDRDYGRDSKKNPNNKPNGK